MPRLFLYFEVIVVYTVSFTAFIIAIFTADASSVYVPSSAPVRAATMFLIFSSESILYKDEPWGDNNLMETFGPYIHDIFKENEIYNVGSGKSRKVIELAQIISKERRYVFVPKRPGEPEVTFADISKISKELKWNPSTTLEEGLSIILESKSDWKDAPVWTPESISKATADWFKYLGSPNG